MKKYRAGIDIGSTTVKLVVLDDADEILYGEYRRHQAHTQETLSTLLEEAKKSVGECELQVCITGSGAINLGKALDISFVQEVVAVATALKKCAPQTDVAIELGVLLAFYVLRLEIDDMPLRNRYQPEVQRQRKAADDQRPEEIGPHQAAERHAAREHGDDLGLVGHLRGEEDAGDEGEQSAELVDEERDEIQVVVEYHLVERGVQFREVVDLLHVVEQYDHDDNHRDGEEVGREEFPQYVAV